MRTFIAIALGLVAGAAAALGLAVAVYSLVPAAPAPTAAATSSPVAVLPSPTPVATPAATASPVAGGSTEPGPTRSISPFPLVGQPAPPLVAPGLDGATIDLAAYRGKPVWIVFTGTYCPPCRDEYPLMNGFAVRYADTDLVVLAIHVKEDAATVKPFVEGLNVTFPVALDGDGSRARTWDALALPVHYWIDEAGIVRDAALGGLGPDQMARSLGTILPGVTIGE
ncbi:MAG TPA: TlpA disulfide reductase family protein [Candidatus Nanopelagicales bacterium]|nr:TlpA disulfide reductase family protein [Candidatus Nanopelagicales bacterium]